MSVSIYRAFCPTYRAAQHRYLIAHALDAPLEKSGKDTAAASGHELRGDAAAAQPTSDGLIICL
jgi:hypothetical protein